MYLKVEENGKAKPINEKEAIRIVKQDLKKFAAPKTITYKENQSKSASKKVSASKVGIVYTLVSLGFDEDKHRVITSFEIKKIVGKKPTVLAFYVALYNGDEFEKNYKRKGELVGSWNSTQIKVGQKATKSYKVDSTKFWFITSWQEAASLSGGISKTTTMSDSILANKKAVPYPIIINKHSKQTMPIPKTTKYKWLPPEKRVSRNSENYRKKYINWYNKKYGVPPFNWKDADIHHVRPLNYGGDHRISNLFALPKSLHQNVVTPWWVNYS